MPPSRLHPLPSPRHRRAIYVTALTGIIFLVILKITLPSTTTSGSTTPAFRSMKIMAQAMKRIAAHRIQRGSALSSVTDPNRTGLIGPARSPLTTTPGSLPAKRTTTNPQMAALMVRLFRQAGLSPGDCLPVGASGSFPGLLLACLSAARSLQLDPAVILSLGASSYGAGDPEFHILDMMIYLKKEGILPFLPSAISLGGDGDTGKGIGAGVKRELKAQVQPWGIPMIDQPDLEKNVEKRMEIIRLHAQDRPLKLFVNIGGSHANLGTDPRILTLRPGINTSASLPPVDRRGMIHHFLSLDIPCLHLLFIRGLVRDHALPWDPRSPTGSPPASPAGFRRHCPPPADITAVLPAGLPVLAEKEIGSKSAPEKRDRPPSRFN